jgi:hypothetical protein
VQVKFKFYVPYLNKYQNGPLECATLRVCLAGGEMPSCKRSTTLAQRPIHGRATQLTVSCFVHPMHDSCGCLLHHCHMPLSQPDWACTMPPQVAAAEMILTQSASVLQV